MKELIPFSHPFQGKIFVPGSKSITNRVFLLAALAEGETILYDALKSEDTEIMLAALREFGVNIFFENFEKEIRIAGINGKFPASGKKEIFCGNSGTSLRFLTAAAALRDGETLFTGTERMKERPIGDLGEALKNLGVSVEYLKNDGFPPILIRGNGKICGGKIQISGNTSSQFLSALLQVAPFAENPVEIQISNTLVSKPYIQMTIQMLAEFDAEVEVNDEFSHFIISPTKLTSPGKFHIEGDATSATYPLAIAMVTGGEITVQNIYSNSLQGDALFAKTILEKMGAMVDISEKGISVKAPKKLEPLGEINLESMPDAAMTAVVLSAFALGKSRITGLSTLKSKESDRIHALTSNLQKMGANVSFGNDFIEIHGDQNILHGAEIETYDDHRIAMCFSVLGAIVPGVKILNPECVGKTWPGYFTEYDSWKNQF